MKEAEVTDEDVYMQRRFFLRTATFALGTSLIHKTAWSSDDDCNTAYTKLGDPPSPYAAVTEYNNYYEFSTNKEAVRTLAQQLTIQPWELIVDGEVEQPLRLDIHELQQRFPSQQRIYRLRCVEGWSAVLPWDGFPLCTLLKAARPTSDAKYAVFHSLHRPLEMIGQRRNALNWPYLEGLSIAEAMHPLSFVATGFYGRALAKQNGAPLRIVVPWKYGFKSPKAVVRVQLTQTQPQTSWQQAAPSEYGFIANVNPNVPHPRWSQRREVRLGEIKKRRTELFNGYAEQVAGLYTGIDLSKNY